MDDLRAKALLRLSSGESPEAICGDLSISPEQLAEWDRVTEPEDLRPSGLGYMSVQLTPAMTGSPRRDLGLRLGPPDRPANGVKNVHLVRGPTDRSCIRCGRQVIPARFQPDLEHWPAHVLIEEVEHGRTVRVITAEESKFLPPCSP